MRMIILNLQALGVKGMVHKVDDDGDVVVEFINSIT